MAVPPAENDLKMWVVVCVCVCVEGGGGGGGGGTNISVFVNIIIFNCILYILFYIFYNWLGYVCQSN